MTSKSKEVRIDYLVAAVAEIHDFSLEVGGALQERVSWILRVLEHEWPSEERVAEAIRRVAREGVPELPQRVRKRAPIIDRYGDEIEELTGVRSFAGYALDYSSRILEGYSHQLDDWAATLFDLTFHQSDKQAPSPLYFRHFVVSMEKEEEEE